jgi:hypothetical protein
MIDIMMRVEPNVLQTLKDGTDGDQVSLRFRLLPLAPSPKSSPTSSTGKVTYEIIGEARSASTAIDMLVDVITTLAELDALFLDRLAPLVKKRERNHIARSRELVYPFRPDLGRKARALVPGWYLGTVLSNPDKVIVLKQCCKAAGLIFGVDLKTSIA